MFMTKIKNFFNLRSFIVLILITFVLIFLIVNIKYKNDKEKFELKKQTLQEDESIVFLTGEEFSFSDYLDFCNWKESDVSAVEFGVKIDESRIRYYYFNGKDVISDVLKVFENVIFFEGTSNKDLNTLMVSDEWEVRFFADKKEYTIHISGYSSKYDNVEIVDVSTSRAEYRTRTDLLRFPNFYNIMNGSKTIVKGSVYKDIVKLYDKYVDNISIDKLCTMKNDGYKLEDLYMYTHTLEKTMFYDEYGDREATTIWVYMFPIKDTECCIELWKYNDGGSYNVDGIEVEPPCNDIISVQVCNSSGEKMNLYECSEEELKDFF